MAGENTPDKQAKAPEKQGKLQLLRDEQASDYQIHLLVDEDKCRAYFVFRKMDPGFVLKTPMIRSILETAAVTNGIRENVLKELAEKSMAGALKPSDEPVLVAEGKPPVHGRDGRIQFLVEPSPEDAHFVIDKDEAVDYRNTNLIKNVMAEQHLAIVIQPTPKEDGMDIFGHTVQAREGVPIKVRLGMNVTLDGEKVFSTAGGRFILQEDELSVNPVYQVRGDVDYTIGNINFIGSVVVQKDVLDEFSVIGKEKVEVGGVVGSANVESDGDVFLNGGVNGKGRGFIRAHGKINAKYLNDVTAVGRDGVEVSKSIMNSTVKTKGKIAVSSGNIIGGSVIALKGVDAAVIGSDLGILTNVTVGVDYELQDRLKAYEAQLQEIGGEIDRIERIIGPLLADKAKLLELPAQKKMAIKGLLQQVKNFRSEQGRIRKQMDEMQSEAVTDASLREIQVRKMLFSGVRIAIGNCKRVIKMEVKGPVRLREDTENETISITNLQL